MSGADRLNGQGSAHPSEAVDINSVSPTGVIVNADVGGNMIRCFVDRGATVSLISSEKCGLEARGISG